MLTLVSTLIFLPLSLFAQSNTNTTLTTPEAPRLVGYWKSTQPEQMGDVYVNREMNFTLSRWEETLFFSKTPDMKKVLVIARAEGPYNLKSSEGGQWNLDLNVALRALKLPQGSSSLPKILEVSRCAIGSKNEVSISDAGCGIFPSVKKCPQQYESVEVREGLLHLSDRPAARFTCAESARIAKAGAPLKKVH